MTQKDTGFRLDLRNPRDCDDFSWLIGLEHVIRDEVYVVISVSHLAHPPPFIYGEQITIFLERKPSKPRK